MYPFMDAAMPIMPAAKEGARATEENDACSLALVNFINRYLIGWELPQPPQAPLPGAGKAGYCGLRAQRAMWEQSDCSLEVVLPPAAKAEEDAPLLPNEKPLPQEVAPLPVESLAAAPNGRRPVGHRDSRVDGDFEWSTEDDPESPVSVMPEAKPPPKVKELPPAYDHVPAMRERARRDHQSRREHMDPFLDMHSYGYFAHC